MARYIDADKAINELADMHCKSDEDGYVWIIRSDAWWRIDSIPSADVRENVHGEWIDREVIDDRKDAKIQQWQQAQCSICGKWHTNPYMYYFEDYDFCPNCGADMRRRS